MALIKTEPRLNWTLYHYDNESEATNHATKSKYRTFISPPGGGFITYVVHEHYYNLKG